MFENQGLMHATPFMQSTAKQTRRIGGSPRILHVITGLQAAGCEMTLLKLLSARNDKWDQAVVSLSDEGTLGPRIADLGVPVHALGMRKSFLDPFRLFSIVPLVSSFRPQLIVGWMYHGNLAASLAANCFVPRLPVLWNIQQSIQDISNERRSTAALVRIGVPLSRQPVAIIYNSRISSEQHQSFGYCAARSAVIPTGYDCRQFRPDPEARHQVRAELGLPEDAVVVGLIARYHPMKDHAGFLKAASLVARAHPHVHFLLAGMGVTHDEPELQRLMVEYQLDGRVLLLGERKDVSRVTAALDIACSASAWGEGFSNAVGEAMACEVPCVVTDVGDSAYLVSDTGLAVPPRSPEAFASAINQLVESGADRRRQLGQAARRRVETEFSLASVARGYEDLYEKYLTP
jgi:glycosyltransferase involved in cell wall biosynthesis